MRHTDFYKNPVANAKNSVLFLPQILMFRKIGITSSIKITSLGVFPIT